MPEYYEAQDMEEYYEALQRRINDGTIWRLEGAAGRAAMQAINDGFCMLGHEPSKDYWGNYIPSRHEISPGHIGSPDYVRDQQGQMWIETISESAQLQLN